MKFWAAVKDASTRAASRVRTNGWRLVEQAVAATLAWVIASQVVDHRQPFFAPIAAIVALNAPLGERGGNALRLLQGVIIGIVAGELALDTIHTTFLALLLAALAGMVTARALGGTMLTVSQAAGSAILTVTIGDAQVGPDRLIDALIGGGVALMFSQILFTPEPVRLLRYAESRALAEIADAFDLTARAIEDNDQRLADEAIDNLRDLRDRLAELERTRHASHRVARHSAAWRGQRDPLVQEAESADQLDLLGASALVLVRNATIVEGDMRDVLAAALRELAGQVRALAQDPGGQAVRQRVASDILKAARRLRSDDRVDDALAFSAVAATMAALRSTAVDILAFMGADADQAAQAIRRGDRDIDLRPAAHAPRIPFKLPWRRRNT
jgi:uncharacterized membrane protein YgaE (UPF0421/DUF939 family)